VVSAGIARSADGFLEGPAPRPSWPLPPWPAPAAVGAWAGGAAVACAATFWSRQGIKLMMVTRAANAPD